MVISIDITAIREHISILKKEIETVNDLIYRLNIWKKECIQSGVTDVYLIENQLDFAEKQIVNINNRILFLESAADRFSEVKRKTKENLNVALDFVKNFDIYSNE